jgi:hypothetical protein
MKKHRIKVRSGEKNNLNRWTDSYLRKYKRLDKNTKTKEKNCMIAIKVLINTDKVEKDKSDHLFLEKTKSACKQETD